MVSPVAQLIVKIAVFQQDPAQDPGLDQELEGSVNGGPSHSREPTPQRFGGEVALLGGNGVGDRLARQRRAVPFPLKGAEQFLCQSQRFPSHLFDTKYL